MTPPARQEARDQRKLAERLGTSRNALYKTVHDARGQLRAHLTAAGYLATTISPEVTR